ncbi:MAG: hypothetical protein ABSE45_01735 [Candidatus Acidiferrales bacterium]|jgi:hypothetical protein
MSRNLTLVRRAWRAIRFARRYFCDPAAAAFADFAGKAAPALIFKSPSIPRFGYRAFIFDFGLVRRFGRGLRRIGILHVLLHEGENRGVVRRAHNLVARDDDFRMESGDLIHGIHPILFLSGRRPPDARKVETQSGGTILAFPGLVFGSGRGRNSPRRRAWVL